MIDHIEIDVEGGKGGAGAVAFLREKFLPFGGPDGGNGGPGGDVYLKASSNLNNLKMLGSRPLYRAGKGTNGLGKKQHGKKGKNIVLEVPLGTIVYLNDEQIADLEEQGLEIIIARGGKGGWGNAHYTTPTNQAPHIAQKGEPGEVRRLRLELRLIADAGIIGYPNVGKSSLLAAASRAKPEIANYAFTTKEPEIGVVETGFKVFTLVEIPGLITGAHLGKGLGYDFLRHAMRTKILIHLIDGASVSPVQDMVQVNMELELFDRTLARRPQLVAVNKIDVPEVRAKVPQIRQDFKDAGISPFFISAAAKEGIDELMAAAFKLIEKTVMEAPPVPRGEPVKIFKPEPRDGGINVRKDGEMFILSMPHVEKMMQGLDLNNPEVQYLIERQVTRPGIKAMLRRAGVKTGDRVRCGDYEWVWSAE